MKDTSTRQALLMIGDNAQAEGLSCADVFGALGESYGKFHAMRYICDFLAFLCTIFTPTGALIFLSIGSLLTIKLLVNAAAWVWNHIRMISSFLNSGVGLGEAVLRGIFSDTQADADPGSFVPMIEAGLLTVLPAPLVAGVNLLLDKSSDKDGNILLGSTDAPAGDEYDPTATTAEVAPYPDDQPVETTV